MSPEAGRLLDEAVAISVRREAYYVGVEHLFDATVYAAKGLPAAFMARHANTLQRIAALCYEHGWQGSPPDVGQEIYYTPRCAAVLNDAVRFAERFRSGPATAAHVLLAVLADAQALPSRICDESGFNRESIVSDLLASAKRNGAAVDVPAPSPASPKQSGSSLAEPMEADEETTGPEAPNHEEFTRDLTQAAREGRLSAATGRQRETMQLLEILARHGKHNAVLVGEAGTGKTKIVEGLACDSARGRLEGVFEGARVLELNLAGLMAGTQHRGALEEKLLALLYELKEQPNTILFIDEIHLMMGAGATDGDSMDLANLLKPVLARGELRVIGATTAREYRKFIAADPAIERRFQMVRVEPLSPEATFDVLRELKPGLEEHHGIRISSQALRASIQLSERYLPNRQFPDKAIDVLDQACARYRIRQGMRGARIHTKTINESIKVRPHDIRRVISQMASVPVEQITQDERQRLVDLDKRLAKRIIGQEDAIARVVAAVQKARAGLSDPNRPDASMLFAGPTGVGKTQLAKELSRTLFGSSAHLITFDMSEYTSPESVNRLLGAPPGYAGCEEEGLLVKAIQDTPFSILLFDEIEKAHPKVFDVFLPLLDEGRLKDRHGRMLSFRNAIVVFTSNVGAEDLQDGAEEPEVIVDALREHFRPEFINRIDEIVPFRPLLFEDVRSMLRGMVDDLRSRMRDRGIGIRMYQGAYEYLATQGYSKIFGARELRRAVDRHVANPISRILLTTDLPPGSKIDVLMEDGQLVHRIGDAQTQSECVSA